jgi:hypothetical protein
MRRTLKRWWYKITGMTPAKMPMVSYWKRSDHVEAKLTEVDGYQMLVMQGEKEPVRGFPRGHLLIPHGQQYGEFSVLKHQVKQVFNRAWEHKDPAEMKKDLGQCLGYLDPLKYDLLPPGAMNPAVREIHRAWTEVAPGRMSYKLRDALCLILAEDDGYRYRVMWMSLWIPLIKWNPVKILGKALERAEHAEVVDDMKERIRLLRHGLLLILKDRGIRARFERFFREIDWGKVRITESERYHLRAKYFKADMDVLEY